MTTTKTIRPTWWELIQAAKEQVTSTSGGFKDLPHTWLGEGDEDTLFITVTALDDETAAAVDDTLIDIEFAIGGKPQELIQIVSNAAEPNILRFSRHMKANEKGEMEELPLTTLAHSFTEENNLPEEWQSNLIKWVNSRLYPACEPYWRTDVIDVLDHIHVNRGLMFIIPNPAKTAANIIIKSVKEQTIEDMKKIAELNGVEFEPESTKLIQVWMASPRAEWLYDNLEDHGPAIRGAFGDRYRIDFPVVLPETLLAKMSEGKPIDIAIPTKVSRYHANHEHDEAYHTECLIYMNDLIPAQTITRYRSFGTFQEVRDKLLGK